MPAPKVTIQEIISTTAASSARQQKNRGNTLFQILRPATNFGVSETRPVFVKRRAQTAWKVFKITKVAPTGDGKKSRVWADVYFGGVCVEKNKRLTGVNKRGAWKLMNPMEIDALEPIYTQEIKNASKWSQIVKQDDAAVDKKGKSVWDITESPEDAALDSLAKAKQDLIALMRVRYQSGKKTLREDSKMLLEEEETV